MEEGLTAEAFLDEIREKLTMTVFMVMKIQWQIHEAQKRPTGSKHYLSLFLDEQGLVWKLWCGEWHGMSRQGGKHAPYRTIVRHPANIPVLKHENQTVALLPTGAPVVNFVDNSADMSKDFGWVSPMFAGFEHSTLYYLNSAYYNFNAQLTILEQILKDHQAVQEWFAHRARAVRELPKGEELEEDHWDVFVRRFAPNFMQLVNSHFMSDMSYCRHLCRSTVNSLAMQDNDGELFVSLADPQRDMRTT